MLNSKRPWALLPRIIGGLLLVLLSGCSAIKLGYNNAPSLTYWWLDSYIDFNEAQTQQVRESLAALHAWHRKQELPAYAETARRMQRLGNDKVTPEQMCDLATQVRAHLQKLGEQSERPLSALVATLKPEQFKHLAAQFDKRNQKWREEWIEGSQSERQARRLKVAVDRAETFYGRLDEPQLAILRSSIANSSFDARVSYREVLRRQQDILETLREHSSTPVRSTHIRAEMLALTERSLNSPDPLYRPYFEKMLTEGCRTLATLHNSASPAQRDKAINRLRGYEEDFKILALQEP